MMRGGFLAGSLLFTFLCVSAPLRADLYIRVGPPSIGSGGPNPLDIPPVSIIQYELMYLTESQTEWSLALYPGIFYGHRFPWDDTGLYASLGGGIVLARQGIGPGIYSAFGYERCWGVCVGIEYKNGLGLTTKGLVSSYSVRVGLGVPL